MSVPKFIIAKSCVSCKHFEWRNGNPYVPYCVKHDYAYEDKEFLDLMCEDFEAVKSE